MKSIVHKLRTTKLLGLLRGFLKFLIYFVLICIAFVYLQPIIEMITKSIMSADDIIDPAVEWVPRSFSLNNLKVAAGVLNLKSTLVNSLLWSGGLAVCQTIVSAMTGYALSRYDFKFKKAVFLMILLAFIIPVPVLMVPRLMMFVSVQEMIGFNLIGTAIPQAAMALLGQGVYSTVLILIFQNFFNMIPRALDEAAQIDGAGPLQVFYHVVVKMSISTVLVVFLFSFVWNWNETYVTGTLMRNTIPLLPAKLSLFNSEFESAVSSAGSAFKINEAYKMAATLISIAPLLILYMFVQKRFIEGIENTGITGE